MALCLTGRGGVTCCKMLPTSSVCLSLILGDICIGISGQNLRRRVGCQRLGVFYVAATEMQNPEGEEWSEGRGQFLTQHQETFGVITLTEKQVGSLEC